MNYLLYNDDMEEELFKKTKFIKEKLLKYGFKKIRIIIFMKQI